MSISKLLPVVFLVLIIQTIFAFYYSSQIVDLNQSFYQHQLTINQLQIQHQSLETLVNTQQSLPQLKLQINPNLFPITNQLQLDFWWTPTEEKPSHSPSICLF